MSRSERVDLISAVGSFSSCSLWTSLSRVLGAASREVAVEQVLVFGGSLFRAEFLGRRRVWIYWVHAGCASYCVEGKVEKGVEFGFDFLGDSYGSWVAVQNEALQRGQSGDLFLRAAIDFFFCCRRSFRAFFQGLLCVFHSSFVIFLFSGGRWGCRD